MNCMSFHPRHANFQRPKNWFGKLSGLSASVTAHVTVSIRAPSRYEVISTGTKRRLGFNACAVSVASPMHRASTPGSAVSEIAVTSVGRKSEICARRRSARYSPIRSGSASTSCAKAGSSALRMCRRSGPPMGQAWCGCRGQARHVLRYMRMAPMRCARRKKSNSITPDGGCMREC